MIVPLPYNKDLSLQIRVTCSDNCSFVTLDAGKLFQCSYRTFPKTIENLKISFLNVDKVGLRQITRNLLLWSKKVYLVLTILSTAEYSRYSMHVFLKRFEIEYISHLNSRKLYGL